MHEKFPNNWKISCQTESLEIDSFPVSLVMKVVGNRRDDLYTLQGVEMEEESIELPKEPITQFGPFTVYVTVCTLNIVTTTVQCVVKGQFRENHRFRKSRATT